MTNGRLLILDDDQQIGRLIQIIAESVGFEARYLTSTSQFFAALGEWQPSHIAIDLIMPDMDGVQVLVRLAALHCTARIIITSGVGTRVLDAAGRSGNEHGLDMAGVLSKPFSANALRELLRQPRPEHAPVAGPLVTSVACQVPTQDAPGVADLAQALTTRQLQVAYQPQISCSTGRLAGVEALVRWVHPELGPQSPEHYIALAEQNGLIDELTFEVTREALDWFIAHFAAAAHDVTWVESPPSLSVNISAIALRDADFIERLSQHCLESGLDPTRLIFELTETSAMEDPVASLDILTRLRMKGFQLSIDDFGTGFSSMLQLVRLPFSEIKIDKSFVMTAARSVESHAVVKSIIELGHSLGLRVVAEGVEDAPTLRLLHEMGCDVVQGYFLGRPVSGGDLLAWLTRSVALQPSAAAQTLLL